VLADSLVLDAASAVGQTLSDSHFVAMFPALAGARFSLKRADWAGAQRAAAAAVELGRRGAGQVELAAALLTAGGGRQKLPASRRAGASGPSRSGRRRRHRRRWRGRRRSGGADRRGARHCPALCRSRAAGRHLAEEQRAEAARTRQEGLIEPLTDRELTILRLLPAPTSLRELASALFVTPNTLKTHLRAIYRKLGAESREEAVIRGHERGFI